MARILHRQTKRTHRRNGASKAQTTGNRAARLSPCSVAEFHRLICEAFAIRFSLCIGLLYV